MCMRVLHYLNTTKEAVETKQHSIWIGISLGNKYFTPEHIKAYIAWALEHTKDRVQIVVADAIYAINLEVLDGKNPDAAMQRALLLGEQKVQEIQQFVDGFPEKEKIRIRRWNDVARTDAYQKKLNIVKNEYRANPAFREYVIRILTTGRADRVEKISKLSPEKLDRLAEYVLEEIPLFVDGMVDREDPDVVYTLIPYPGITLLDELFVDVQQGTTFPELTKKLQITHAVGIVDAWVEE